MKKAFTLAESLITITIIGVIAVLIYSNIVRMAPDENATLYKKSFYTVQEAVKTLANDVTKYPDSELMFKYTTGAKSYAEEFCTNVANLVNTLGDIKCSTNMITTDASFKDGKYDFKLANGTWVSGLNQAFSNEDNNNLTSDSITICVDVNGLKKGINKGCLSNETSLNKRDQFKIRIHFDGKVSTGSGEEWDVENAILEETGVNTR